MSTLTDVLAVHRSEGLRCMCGYQASSRDDHIAHVAEAVGAAGLVVLQLPEPNSTRYEGSEHGPVDRLGWWRANEMFGVSQWGYPDQVQLAYDGEPFEPLSVDEARFIAVALLAAANAAEAVNA